MSPSVETGHASMRVCRKWLRTSESGRQPDFSQSRSEKSRPVPLGGIMIFSLNPRGSGLMKPQCWRKFAGPRHGRIAGRNQLVPPRVRRCFFAACAPLLAATAACSSFSVPSLPAAEDMLPLAPKLELKTLPTSPVRQLGPPALVGADGSCSAGGGQSEFGGTGIALEMSECDV